MKKTIIIIVVLVVVGILGFVAYSFLASSKVSQEFIDKHNEIVALGKDAAQLADLTSMPEMDAFNKQMDDEDYKGAIKSLESALGRKKEANSKLNSIASKLAELNVLSAKISDAKMKTDADKFIDMSKKENSAKINYYNLQIKLVEKTKEMVGVLAKGPISPTDEKTINDLIEELDGVNIQVDNAKKEVDDIQSQYKAAEKEFFELAGLEIAE